MSKIIAIAAQKGGAAKTTSTISISSYLASLGYKVLLVDIDAQENSTYVFLNKPVTEIETVAILLDDSFAKVGEAIHPTAVTNLQIMPAHSRLSEADVVLSTLMARESRLKMVLDKVKSQFDFVLIDCPPNLGWIPINAFVAADYVLIPVSPDVFDLKGIKMMMNNMDSVIKYHNKDLKLLGMFMTKFDHRNSISHEIYELLQNKFGELVFKTKIPINTALQKANAHKQDIFTFDSKATGALAYKALVEKELLPKLNITN